MVRRLKFKIDDHLRIRLWCWLKFQKRSLHAAWTTVRQNVLFFQWYYFQLKGLNFYVNLNHQFIHVPNVPCFGRPVISLSPMLGRALRKDKNYDTWMLQCILLKKLECMQWYLFKNFEWILILYSCFNFGSCSNYSKILKFEIPWRIFYLHVKIVSWF